jgi:hypothetical protein
VTKDFFEALFSFLKLSAKNDISSGHRKCSKDAEKWKPYEKK